MRLPPGLRVPLGYLLVAIAATWPLVLDLGTALSGYPNVDAMDTVMLRGLLAEMATRPWEAPDTLGIYFPVGFPILWLAPNLLDHLTAAPLVLALPFPWADNLWWIAVLALNGACAHRLGRRLGGTEAAGWLAGISFALAEPVAREANLGHAPQAMLFAAPLYLHALVDLREALTRRSALLGVAGGREPPSPKSAVPRPASPAPAHSNQAPGMGGQRTATLGRGMAKDLRAAALAGLWLGVASLGYWYHGLFLLAGSLPLLVGLPARRLALAAAVTGALSAPFLMPHLLSWGEMPLTSGAVAPPPAELPAGFAALAEGDRFVAWHGNDPLFWLRAEPIDVSNRVALTLLLAAVLGAARLPRRISGSLAFMVFLGAIMLLGSHLRLGEGLLLAGDRAIRLPFDWMRDLHPILGRLTWPERWGMLVALGLSALAARAGRPGWLAALVLIESFALSRNLPLQVTPIRDQLCWSALEGTAGAVVELPLARPGLMAPRAGVHRRLHRRPVVNPVLLPPGAEVPADWNVWLANEPMMVYLSAFEGGKWPDDPGAGAVRALRSAGVGVIALDVEPGGVLTAGGINRYRTGLGRHLGPPIDLGCALAWWIDAETPPPAGLADGDARRQEAAAWHEAHPAPELRTLIRPLWNAIAAKGG